MNKNCVIVVIKKLYFAKFLDFIWTWILHFLKIFLTLAGVGLSFKNSELDLDCKI